MSRAGRMTTLSPEVESAASDIIGAAIEVHRTLGPGYLESVYEEALAHELSLRGLSYLRQPPIRVIYKDRTVGEGRADLVVAGLVLVELKAVEAIHPVHEAQVISYLKATGLRLGLLINFQTAVLKNDLHRIIL